MRDNKLLNVKIQVFHKSGRHIKTYIYTTGHTEWMGLISYPLLSVFSSFSKNNWFTDVNRLNYSQDADIIFSNFIADFNRDITNNQYPEFAATTVSQNEMITGVEMFGKLEDGLSVLQVKPGLIYRGNIKDGLPNGLGSLSDGSTILIGEWINGKLSGKGKIQYADGSVYSGMLLDSRPHGQGKLIKPDNEIKEGQWNNGIFEQ